MGLSCSCVQESDKNGNFNLNNERMKSISKDLFNVDSKLFEESSKASNNC